MSNPDSPTIPQPVSVTPVAPTTLGTQTGTAAAPLAGTGNRVSFGTIGRLPTQATPITPVRGTGGRRK
jgi:hypothetical protein